MTVLVRLTEGYQAGQRPRPGQALILLALVFVVLMGSLGLALDGGYNFGQRRIMQNAADAAALAGAKAVSQGKSNVRSIVEAVAIQNGVQDASRVECTWINNQIPFSTVGGNNSCNNAPLGLAIAGVQVTVREEHSTFVMRVLGISTASTAATATAQVQILNSFKPGPFVICGVGTYKTSNPNGSVGGILKGSGANFAIDPVSGNRVDGMYGCDIGGKAPCEQVAEKNKDANGYPYGEPLIDDSMYYYDWDKPNPLANPIDHDGNALNGTVVLGPTFLFHGPNNVTGCNITSANFKGINQYNETITFTEGSWSPPYVKPDGTTRLNGTLTPFDNGFTPNLATSVLSVNGCVQGGALNNCVLLLPVMDASGPGGPGNTYVAVRTVAAVYIQESGNRHTGRLIKNYPMVGTGSGGFTTDTNAPIVIRLVE